tara:strand:- start:15575 stop:17482 length:1908 start_codon:yes stop_codon:yes gene_type:complete
MLKDKILSLSRRKKRVIIILIDYLSMIVSFYLAAFLLFKNISVYDIGYFIVIYSPPVVAILFYYYSGLYQNILRFMHTGTFFTLFNGALFYSVFLMIAPALLLDDGSFAYSLIAVNFLMLMFVLTSTRLVARWFLVSRNKSQKKIIIYGAGNAGVQISNAILGLSEYSLVAFIDDDPDLSDTKISDVPVYSYDQIKRVISEYDVKELLVAIPSLSDIQRRRLFSKLEALPIKIRTLPNISEIVSGRVQVEDIRNIEIEDLLQREIIKPKNELIQKNINGKVVLITGAGGSIGSEIARQVVKNKPSRIILYEANEFSLYSIEKEIKIYLKNNGDSEISFSSILGNMHSVDSLIKIFRKYSVNTIYHAAAYKHVPLVEDNQIEGVQNNIFGSLNILKASIISKIENFVLISTDKAVNPTSMMGATKRFVEIVIQSLADVRESKSPEFNFFHTDLEVKETLFSIVRFGNVLNSSGSVVPLFKEQIENGGPITVTDPNIIRYFMSISEAVELVIQAGAMSEGGDIFILDMGEPITIADLARKMIKLSGFDLKDETDSEKSIEIVYTGLRPGEKLYEDLHIDPVREETLHPKIFKTTQEFLAIEEINKFLDMLDKASKDDNPDRIYEILKQAIPEYKPNI